jgi:hypothetical protein
MRAFFEKNHFGFGMALGAVLPLITFMLLFLADEHLMHRGPGAVVVPPNIMAFLSIALNLLPFRYYMIQLRYERTGRGILFSTFMLGFINVLYLFLVVEGNAATP